MLNPYITAVYPLQAWQYVMLPLLVSCLFSLMAGLVMDFGKNASRQEIYSLPKWLLIPAGLGIMMFCGMPATIIFQFMFVMFMDGLGAPMSSVIVMSLMIFGSWILFVYASFGHIGRRA